KGPQNSASQKDLKIELPEKEPQNRPSQEKTLKKVFPIKDLKKEFPKKGPQNRSSRKYTKIELRIKGPQNRASNKKTSK
ncbi:hypothetical protein BpHYR1_036180, partial [Brachionus plicatilis]